MRWVNLKVSGNVDIWPVPWFLFSLAPEVVPVDYALSLGCGPGNLEREVIRLDAARRITGVDISDKSLEIAEGLAKDAGFSDRIVYRTSSALEWLREGETVLDIDLVFFHGSLHHMEPLEALLDLCGRRLLRGSPGLLFVDEYIGPSREEWGPGDIEVASNLFERIPERCRCVPYLVPPIACDDPSEMIRSSEILPLLRERFELLEYRPYFGNVLMPLVSGIKASALDDPGVRLTLREAMKIEDDLARSGELEPLHAVVVAKPKG